MQVPPSLSRPASGYEDLSLDDNDDDVERSRDPWASPQSTAKHDSARFSTASSSFGASPSSSRTSGLGSIDLGAGTERPGLERYTSTSASTVTSGRVEDGRLVLGVAVVDFNHLVGPTVELAYPPSLQEALNDDEELNRLLPFLALPDGAHLSEEDYSYFHCAYMPSGKELDTDVPPGQTLFGISCNRQLPASELLRRPSDVTRSTVQKAVIVIASQPVFGPIRFARSLTAMKTADGRDQLGVVTRAYFAQRDFTQTEIIEDFYNSLEGSLEGKSDESSIYMGTSLRELVHKFRHKTLILLKMLLLQKRMMLFGYPVEMLCTYQYSLVSLIPGLLLSLRDSGHPELDLKPPRARPTSLRSSDRSSMLKYIGLPLHLFGKDAFFQPYLPLQQVDTLKTRSWLVGTTNQIVTQQRDCKYDLLVNIENVSFTFSDPKLEKLVSLTPADRMWMDDVVRTVEETWGMDPGARTTFRGSDDDLRQRFEEYLCAALASIKFTDFVTKGQANDLTIVGLSGEGGVLQAFGESWLAAFRTTPAFERWDACTDPALFDIVEPKHPCEGKASVVSDLGLRLTEGLHDLHIDQQLAPTRAALSSAFTAGSSAVASGSSSLFKAFDGLRNDVSSHIELERQRREKERAERAAASPPPSAVDPPGTATSTGSGASGTSGQPAATAVADIGKTLGAVGSGIGSFFGSKYASLRGAPAQESKGLRPMSLSANKR